jgi:penicillin-binding protein activator
MTRFDFTSPLLTTRGRWISSRALALFGLLALAGASQLTTGCGPKAVRGSDVAGLDDAAMGTGLDKADLKRMLETNLSSLQTSAAVKRWEGEERPPVSVLPIRNETTEHIEGALDALISDIESSLVNAGHVRVISAQDQPELVEKVRAQQTDAYDQSQIAQWGTQVGAKYFVTGKVYTVDERQDGERRVQYFLFMRVLEAATGDILWQNKTSVTKAIVN